MTDVLAPDDIRRQREALDASVRDFDILMGYRDTNGRMTMAIEAGTRHGKPFAISGPAWAALKYSAAILRGIKMLERGAPTEAVIACLREPLPEAMR